MTWSVPAGRGVVLTSQSFMLLRPRSLTDDATRTHRLHPKIRIRQNRRRATRSSGILKLRDEGARHIDPYNSCDTQTDLLSSTRARRLKHGGCRGFLRNPILGNIRDCFPTVTDRFVADTR